MPDHWTPLEDGLRAAMLAAWPDLLGIYTPAQIPYLSLEQKAEADQLPLGILDHDLPADLTRRHGIHNRKWRGQVRMYYIGWQDADQDGWNVRLWALVDYLLSNELPAGSQALGPGTPKVAPRDVPAQVYFLAFARPYEIGSVSVEVVTGHTP